MSSLEGTFPKKKEGTNPKMFFCECCSIVLCWTILYGSVQSIQQEERRDFRGNLWHENRGNFWKSSCYYWAVLCRSYNTLLGTVFKAQI
jgi:hypothetical protein